MGRGACWGRWGAIVISVTSGGVGRRPFGWCRIKGGDGESPIDSYEILVRRKIGTFLSQQMRKGVDDLSVGHTGDVDGEGLTIAFYGAGE
jgi:hypothetical protein